MITADPKRFVAAVRELAPLQPGSARGVLLVRPQGFRVSSQSASDNAYMHAGAAVDAGRALAQHALLEHALRQHSGLEIVAFDGALASPDAVFANNVYASCAGQLVVGAMRHPERRVEAERVDIAAWFAARGAVIERLDARPGVIAELTGSMVIDRARGVGFIGLGERCNLAGAQAMHRAFALNASLVFALAPGEYHTNVVLSVLAGRAAVYDPQGFADPRVAEVIAAIYGEQAIAISAAEKHAFVANCLALSPQQLWLSACAERALAADTRQRLRDGGFVLHSVTLDEIELAGGSLRCCIAEIY